MPPPWQITALNSGASASEKEACQQQLSFSIGKAKFPFDEDWTGMSVNNASPWSGC